MTPRSAVFVFFLLGVITILPAFAQDTYGPVQRGEDLWNIARQIYPEHDVSRDQVMLALLKANPEAFDAPCNVNSPLKVGAKLQIPSLAEVQALSRADALQEFEGQLRQWEIHRKSGQALVCPPASAVATSTAGQPSSPVSTTVTSPASPATTSIPEEVSSAAKQAEASDLKYVPDQRILGVLEWTGIPILVLLIAGILLWKYRRPSTADAPSSPATESAEGRVDYAKMTVEDTLAKLNTDRTQGLSASEAAKRLQDIGPNALEEKQVTLLERIVPYFWGPIPWMIEAAALLSLLTKDWNDFIVISALLLFNAFISFREEASASNALAALKGQLALQARALRDGQWQEVEARDLVPGDMIRIRLGDVIPADAKLIDGDYLSVDQAAL
ncbi:MAG: hypothetical protein KDI50_10430, partial [Candidatus Competibacteraceae bacterium]|nr:hypothetical protein [Candidatus Competibacteraceae bacterium]